MLRCNRLRYIVFAYGSGREALTNVEGEATKVGGTLRDCHPSDNRAGLVLVRQKLPNLR